MQDSDPKAPQLGSQGGNCPPQVGIQAEIGVLLQEKTQVADKAYPPIDQGGAYIWHALGEVWTSNPMLAPIKLVNP